MDFILTAQTRIQLLVNYYQQILYLLYLGSQVPGEAPSDGSLSLPPVPGEPFNNPFNILS